MASSTESRKAIISRVQDEIRKGVIGPAQDDRLYRSKKNYLYAKGDFSIDSHLYLENLDKRCERSVPVMRRIVDVLSQDLYRKPPQRAITSLPVASEFLDAVYRSIRMDARWQQADRATCVNQVACFEVFGRTGLGSALKPIGVRLWGGESFRVWCDPDDALSPIAVALIDQHDEQTRIRLWTHEWRETWLSPKMGKYQTSGGRELTRIAQEANPYRSAPDGEPILPFSFAWWNFPDDAEFWCGSPGDGLRQLNFHVNMRLTKNADDIIHNRPIGVVEGASATYQPPQNRKAGQFHVIPPEVNDIANAGPKPELRYVICDLGYLGSDWDDLDRYLQASLEMNNVPLAAVRLDQARAESGIQIIAEQLPLAMFAESRRLPFGHYERDLASVLFRVAASHVENNFEATGGELLGMRVEELWEAAEASADMQLVWPPGLTEQLKANDWQRNQFRIDNKLVSRTMLVMELEGLDRTLAEDRVRRIAQDMAFEEELFGPVESAIAARQNESFEDPMAAEPVPDEEVATEEETDAETETDNTTEDV